MSSPAQSRAPARSETGAPLLLTPGALTTSKTVKQAMVHDWGSRNATFIALNAEVMESLPKIVHGEGAYVTVPMQGSGAFAVEAMLTTFAPRDGVVLALVNGAWAALALRSQGGGAARTLAVLFFVPSAVPSVSVGLSLLVAFSRRPLLLNGTTAIVFIAHFVLISAFSFGNVSAGLARVSPDFEEVASCLGAKPFYRLRRLTLPLVAPYLFAAFGLTFALSMGELGATVMVYPPGWVTLPVAIFGLTDRGDIFSGAALTIILVAVTLALLLALERISLVWTQARSG
jgi:2-aminoethylphosphonate transport system permease protein